MPPGGGQNPTTKMPKKGPEAKEKEFQKKSPAKQIPFRTEAPPRKITTPAGTKRGQNHTQKNRQKRARAKGTEKRKKKSRRSKSLLESKDRPEKRRPQPAPWEPNFFTKKWARIFLKYPAAFLQLRLRQLLAPWARRWAATALLMAIARQVRRVPAELGQREVWSALGWGPARILKSARWDVREGLLRELSPGPLAPKARIMPLDQAACDD